MTTISPQEVTGTIELAPNYRIPLFLVILSLPLLFLQVWLANFLEQSPDPVLFQRN